MAQQEDFYFARAAEARAEADLATLDNVRDRALRSAAAWEAMATRAAGITVAREARIAEKLPEDVAADDMAEPAE